MGRLFHDPPRQRADVADVLDAGHAAARQGLAVHDASVQADGADGVAQPAVTDGVDLGIILDGLGAGKGRVQGRLACLEDRQRLPHRGLTERPGRNHHWVRHVFVPRSFLCGGRFVSVSV